MQKNRFNLCTERIVFQSSRSMEKGERGQRLVVYTKVFFVQKKLTRKRILPGHKGAPSKTRPGHIDFRTHKGDKYYNRKGHRQTYNRKGVVGTPFVHPN